MRRKIKPDIFRSMTQAAADEDVHGKKASRWRARDDRNSTIDIPNVGGMNICSQQKTAGVSHDIAPAPMDSLAGVESICPASSVIEAV